MGFEVTKHLRHHTWVLKVTWVGVALCWGSTAGQVKVISRSFQGQTGYNIE